MRLTKQAARIYQYSAIFFAISIILIPHPAAVLAPLFLIIFLTAHILLAAPRLKRIGKESLRASLSASPNPVSVGGRVRVKTHVELKTEREWRAEVWVGLGEGLRVGSGSQAWAGSLGPGKGAVLELVAVAERPGILEVGPLRVVIRDDLGVLVRELEASAAGVIVSMEEPGRLWTPPAALPPAGLPSPGHALNPFVGVEEDYRTSVRGAGGPARRLDWRRVARAGGEELYFREYERRRAADLVLGIGSGLDLELPGKGNVREFVAQTLIPLALAHLREGSRPWLLIYREGAPAYSSLYLSRGELRLGEEGAPGAGVLLYVTRLVEPGESGFLGELTGSGRFRAEVLLLDLSGEVAEVLGAGAAEAESRRLEEARRMLGGRCRRVGLGGLGEAVARALASAGARV